MKEVHYNAITGVFTWAYGRRGVSRGAIAGSLGFDGYWRIKINRKVYAAHRLAWFLTHGQWPSVEIDHINGNKLDNRIVNLRQADRSVNSQNKRTAQANNLSCGLLGVTWNKQHLRWQSKLMVKKKAVHVGYFDSPEEAHAAYIAKKRELHAGCTI